MRVLLLLALVATACAAAHDPANGSEGQELLEGLFSSGRKLADNVNGKCRLISKSYLWAGQGSTVISTKVIYTKSAASACCTECQKKRSCIYFNSCWDGRGKSWCSLFK